ncbi:MAG: ubiquinone anaerobic biosynthesis protein UbiU [Pseudomonadota bacterium]
MNANRRLELVCPAGTLPALKAAVDHGADWVYIGFRDQTNARNFPGLNFDDAAAREGVAYAHARGARVLLALNTYPPAAGWRRWTDAVDRAARLRLDALVVADLGLLRYAAERHPALSLHLSVQGSATSHEAINLYHDLFGIRRAVLPRVLSLAQVEQVVAHSRVPIEVFGFGGLCVMLEGRCILSSYVTGESPNNAGVCSPARAVRWQQRGEAMETRLGPVLVNRFGAGEKAGYPTLCKGRYRVAGHTYYAFEEPVSLNTLELLPRLLAMGITAIKLEGRQRSPAYVAQVTRVWRRAIDACRRDPAGYAVAPEWSAALAAVSEGQQCTLGAYHRPWK